MQNDIVRRPSPQPEDRRPQPVQQPVQQQPVVQQQQPAAAPAAAQTPAATTQPADNIASPAINNEPKHKSNSPTKIIVAAVIICLLLVGAAVYLTMNQSKTDPVINKVNEITTTAPSQSAASNTSVDSVVEQANGLSEDTADPSADLSDQALGL